MLASLLAALGGCSGSAHSRAADHVPASTPRPLAAERDDRRPGDWRGSASLLVGGRQLDRDEWDPVDQQPVFGAEIELRPPHSPLGLEIGGLTSFAFEERNEVLAGQPVRAEGSLWISEIYLGPRLTIDGDGFRPYLGGGLTWLHFDLKGKASLGDTLSFRMSDHDSTFAGYLHGGVQIDLRRGLHVGIDLRAVLGANVHLFGDQGAAPLNADYLQAAVLLGGNW